MMLDLAGTGLGARWQLLDLLWSWPAAKEENLASKGGYYVSNN